MRTASHVLAFAASLASFAVLANPLFEGSRSAPLTEMVGIHDADTSGLHIRTLFGIPQSAALALWVRVPLKSGEVYPLLRLNFRPGNGVVRGQTLLLEAAPLGSGHQLVCRFDGTAAGAEGSVCAPLPPSLANRWTHILLHIPTTEFEDLRTQSSAGAIPVALAINGRVTEGTLACKGLGDIAYFLGIGGPGVGVADVRSDIVIAQDGKPVPTADLAKQLSKPDPYPNLREKHPVAPFRLDDFAPTLRKWASAEGPWGPNGYASPYDVSSSGRNLPMLCGDGFTLLFVAKAPSASDETFFSQEILRHPDLDPRGELRLVSTQDGPALHLTLDGKAFPAVACALPDAATAFHAYAVRYDKGELSLWVDGMRMGAVAVPPITTPHDPDTPYLTDPHRLILGGKTVFGSKPPKQGALIDDAAFYDRALSLKELLEAFTLHTITGRQPQPPDKR